jgi:hypothetical protein
MPSYDGSANITNPDKVPTPYFQRLALKYERQNAENARKHKTSYGLYNATSTVVTNNPTVSGSCMIHVYYGSGTRIGSVIG